MADPVAWYDANAETVAARYEEISAEVVHEWLLDLLSPSPATVLDIGAGSGRDQLGSLAKAMMSWLLSHPRPCEMLRPSFIREQGFDGSEILCRRLPPYCGPA